MSDRAYWLAWSRVPGVGSTLATRLKNQFGSLQAAWSADSSSLLRVDGIGQQTVEAICAARQHIEPVDFLEQHSQKNPDFWTPDDSDYPQLLLEIPSYPLVLYYRGQVIPAENQGINNLVAIVGTRNPSEYGKRWTKKLTTTLIQHGFTIVSGLAEGIDTEAHRSCVDRGGRTIAIVGTGVDLVYPSTNRSLYEQILAKGLVMSEYPSGTKPDRQHFPQRNRIIAGLSRAVIVTEAPDKSGALITASLANDYGRDVYVLPGSLDNRCSEGCLKLINNGAQIILGESHLLELLGTLPRLDSYTSSLLSSPDSSQPAPSASLQVAVPPDLEPSLATILQAIPLEPISFDHLVQRVTLPASSVSSALIQLQLMNLVTELPGMRYQRY